MTATKNFLILPDAGIDGRQIKKWGYPSSGMQTWHNFVHENALPEQSWWLRLAWKTFMDNTGNVRLFIPSSNASSVTRFAQERHPGISKKFSPKDLSIASISFDSSSLLSLQQSNSSRYLGKDFTLLHRPQFDNFNKGQTFLGGFPL